MSLTELLERYGNFLFRGLYPVVGGLVFAMLVSSVIYYSQYRPVIKKMNYRPEGKTASFNINRAIAEILNSDVMNLKITEVVNRKPDGRGRPPVSLKNLTLLGVFLGDKKLAVIKNGDELLYLKEGDRLSGYRVSDLRFNSVVLEGKKGRFILTFPEEKNKEKFNQKRAPVVAKNEAIAIQDRVIVKRQEVLEKAKDLNKLLTTLRIAPYYLKGEFIGYRLAMIKRNSFLYKIGLRAGDIIKRINGEDVSSPERLVEMLSKLDTVTAVNIDMLRGGKKKTLFIEIED